MLKGVALPRFLWMRQFIVALDGAGAVGGTLRGRIYWQCRWLASLRPCELVVGAKKIANFEAA
jgi:hypothetical protein